VGSTPGGSKIFHIKSRPALMPTLPPVLGPFPRGKMAGGVHHLPPSSTKVKEIMAWYVYSISGPSWPVLGSNLITMEMVGQ
jgi:hypothetical protein